MRRFKTFLADQRGAVAVETALFSIVLIMLITGGFEAGRAVLLEQKLDRAVNTVSDLVARSETVSSTDLADIYSAAKGIMGSYNLDTNGAVYVSVIKPGSPISFAWQRKLGGTTIASKVGTGTGTVKLPTGFTLDSDEYLVVAEIAYNYAPVMGLDMFGSKTIYQAAFNRPRLAELPVCNGC